MRYTLASEEFNLWAAMTSSFIKMGVSLLLYGIYINLFVLAIYTLSRRSKTKPLIFWSCLMAVLGTTTMAVSVVDAVVIARFYHLPLAVQGQSLSQSVLTIEVLELIESVTFTINNLVTDSFFLYRCFVIWGFQRKVLILPVLLMLSNFAYTLAIVGCLSLSVTPCAASGIQVSYGVSSAINLVLTALTAGRILWEQRVASHLGPDNTLRNRCNTALKLILESGAMYFIVAIFLAIAASLNVEMYHISIAIGEQLVNIIPTFTLVYVGLNNKGDKPPNTGPIRDVPPKQHTPGSSGPVQSGEPLPVLDIRPQGTQEEEDEAV